MDTQNEKLLRWEEQIADYRFPKWQELPELDLYMDQVVSYLGQKLAVFYETGNADEENRGITATMINNYVKQKLIPPPIKKRYNRTHLSALLMLFCVKQVLSIGLSGDLIAVCKNGTEPEAAYTRFCEIFESVLHGTVSDRIEECRTDRMISDAPVLTTAAIAFANKIYAEKLIAMEAAAIHAAGSADRNGDEKPEKIEKEKEKQEKKSKEN